MGRFSGGIWEIVAWGQTAPVVEPNSNFVSVATNNSETYAIRRPSPGDLDGDGDVDVADLATLLAHFGILSGAKMSDGDLDGDNDVDLTDLATLLAVFGSHG